MDFTTVLTLSKDELYEKALSYEKQEDYDNYFIHLTMAANLDHKDAMNKLDDDYINKRNYEQDHSETFKFYEITREYSYSLHYLAWMYYHGKNTQQDYGKARILFEESISRREFKWSLKCLADMYYDGKGVDKDYEKVRELREKVLERGVLSELNWLGNKYFDEDNYIEARKCYEKALDHNILRSTHNLAWMYHRGLGGNRDYGKAKELYEKNTSDTRGYSLGNLASMYFLGEGVERDVVKARELYEKAVECNIAGAAHSLASIYRNGIGVEVDLVKAHDLCEKARKLYEVHIANDRKYIDHLTELYITSDLKNERDYVINYFIKIDATDRLKKIYAYDDFTIKLLVENYRLKNDNNKLIEEIGQLKAHIQASPDGELYFKAKAEWDENKSKIIFDG